MTQVKDFFFRNAQTIVLIAVILIGGWWFLSPSENSPRAQVSNEIYSACLDLDSEHRLVRAIVDIHNVGPVRFKVLKSDLYVHQVVPFENNRGEALLDDGETESKPGPFDWRQLLHIPIAPNSSDEVLKPNESHRQYVDFLIPPSSKVVELKSEVKVGRVASFFESIWINTDEKVSNGEAKTIYDVRDMACAKKAGVEIPAT